MIKKLSLSDDQLVRLEIAKIHEAIRLGPEKTGASRVELIMVAFATCDRQRWLPQSDLGAVELWRELSDVQHAAVLSYLGGEFVRAASKLKPALPRPHA